MGTVIDKMSGGNKLPPKPLKERYNPQIIESIIDSLEKGYYIERYNVFTINQTWAMILAHDNERLIFALPIGLPFTIYPHAGETTESVVLKNLKILLDELRA
jgi:hypothetical protein